jgi:hypothetical protein
MQYEYCLVIFIIVPIHSIYFVRHYEHADLDHIKINCIGNDLQERLERIKERSKFLDVHKIFSNRAIQGSLSGVGVTYRENNLDAVASAYLRW